MAQFIAKIKGQRGEASRLGSKKSGLEAKVNGWNDGVKVVAEHRDALAGAGCDCNDLRMCQDHIEWNEVLAQAEGR